ncbi:hypothetical protein ASPCAL05333 [Aspergillus calidoustus]|uniref:Uncharacterized protein n=1 Tax=Aspergillus calidoustus TaxID=454130 RepID=A0A0U5C6N2_ASPCI|nr:hypothetical protein ASPCAL05333 [Aspergillus calidoustus]
MFLVPALILLLSVSTTALPLAQGGPSKPILEGIPALEGVPVNIHPGGPGIPVLPQHNCSDLQPLCHELCHVKQQTPEGIAEYARCMEQCVAQSPCQGGGPSNQSGPTTGVGSRT